jgi:hypothetical protein
VSRLPPPLRFLAISVGLWTCLRAAVLAPSWWAAPLPPKPAAASGPAPTKEDGFLAEAEIQPHRARSSAPAVAAERAAGPTRRTPAAPTPEALSAASNPSEPPPPSKEIFPSGTTALADPAPRPLGLDPPAAPPSTTSRWSASSWLFWRRGGGPGLAVGGALGGSQGGARALFSVTPALALSARLSAPLSHAAGAESAVGLDWHPLRRVPVHLLAERRQALGREGRSAFDLTVYGGVSDAALGRFRIDAYAQAGLVGARRRDAFADGALRLSLPLGRLKLGAGAWGAAQPGVARVDVGPQVAVGVTLAGHNVTVAADWRVRIAGNARPGSGPAVTLGTDF